MLGFIVMPFPITFMFNIPNIALIATLYAYIRRIAVRHMIRTSTFFTTNFADPPMISFLGLVGRPMMQDRLSPVRAAAIGTYIRAVTIGEKMLAFFLRCHGRGHAKRQQQRRRQGQKQEKPFLHPNLSFVFFGIAPQSLWDKIPFGTPSI